MSERGLDATTATAFDAQVVYPALLFEGEFSTGTGRWWSGVGTLSWGGYSWLGMGGLVGISAIDETTSVEARGFTVSFGGQSSETLAIALGACRQGAIGKIWLASLNAAGAVTGTPYLLRRARLDVPSGEDDGENATISVSYEGRLIDLETAREYRYTQESQRLFYPDDKGFEFVPTLQDAVDLWYPSS